MTHFNVSVSSLEEDGRVETYDLQLGALLRDYARLRALELYGLTKQSLLVRLSGMEVSQEASVSAEGKLQSLSSQVPSGPNWQDHFSSARLSQYEQARSQQRIAKSDTIGELGAIIAGYLSTICNAKNKLDISIHSDRSSSLSMKLTMRVDTIALEQNVYGDTLETILTQLSLCLRAASLLQES